MPEDIEYAVMLTEKNYEGLAILFDFAEIDYEACINHKYKYLLLDTTDPESPYTLLPQKDFDKYFVARGLHIETRFTPVQKK